LTVLAATYATATSAAAGGISVGSVIGQHPLAYVDPGSGQLVWQMVVAGCVGALFYLKQVRSFFGKLVAKWFKKRD
jgi:hypothetical protein